MDYSTIKRELTLDDLSENHLEIAGLIGLDTLVNLSESFGGIQFYIPTLKQLFCNYIYKKVLIEYNGFNAKELALKYDISGSTIYRLVKGSLKS